MVSQEFKNKFPLVFVGGVAAGSLALIGVTISSFKDSVSNFGKDDVPGTGVSAMPFPSRSPSLITPSPTETPSDIVETTPEETPTPTFTPSRTQSASPTPTPRHETPRPSATHSLAPALPDVRVVGSDYIATGAHSGLAYIHSIDGQKNTHSTEFTIKCGLGEVVMSIVSFTKGNQNLILQPQPYPELTTTLCDGSHVAEGVRKNPAEYAGSLLPIAGIS